MRLQTNGMSLCYSCGSGPRRVSHSSCWTAKQAQTWRKSYSL